MCSIVAKSTVNNLAGGKDLLQTFPDELGTDKGQIRDIQEIHELLDGARGK